MSASSLLSFVVIATAIALVSAPTLAQTDTPWIDQRQANQEQRIDRGVASGTLSGFTSPFV